MPKRRTSTSFKLGWKGGPGRPKSTPERRIAAKVERLVIEDIREAAKEHTGQALATIVELLEDGSQRGAAIRLAAARELFDRAYGKPAQAIETKTEFSFAEIVRRSLKIVDVTPPPELGEIMTPEKYRAMQAGSVEREVDRK